MAVNFEIACMDCRDVLLVGVESAREPGKMELCCAPDDLDDLVEFLTDHKRHHLEFGEAFHFEQLPNDPA